MKRLEVTLRNVYGCVYQNMINIVKNGGGSINEYDDDQAALIQQDLVKVTGNKRYLLILDDVWDEDELIWVPLQSILTCGANGCRVVITTRNRGVALAVRSVYIHDLGLLSSILFFPTSL